jgi:flagellar biosynthesis protein
VAADAEKPIKRAIALRYDQGADQAPTVVATGQGLVAERIVELAKEAGVTVEHNPELADALAQVELGSAIPEELYPVVAEVLVFISRMNREKGKASGSPSEPFGKGTKRR